MKGEPVGDEGKTVGTARGITLMRSEVGVQSFVQSHTEGVQRRFLRSSARYTVFGDEPLEARLPPIEKRQTAEQAMELFAAWKSEGAAEDGNIVLAESSKVPTYLTFNTDAGGMNNMRMLLEYAVHLASTTGRTLVLPPQEGWYLIDWGPLNANNKTDMRWLEREEGTWSSYPEFWDVDDLKKHINVESATSFFEREHERLHIPESVDPAEVPPVNSPDPDAWKDWLFKNAEKAVGCEASTSLAQGDAALVHLPSRSKTNDAEEYRYFNCKPNDRGVAFLHFNPRYFNMVSQLLGGAATVKDLKFGAYAAVHLRRNDFQYKQAPSAEGSAAIISELSKYMSAGDPVYISSDEIDDSWWDGFRSALDDSHYRLISMKDFKTDLENMGATRRHLGVIEMVLCAGAKVFFGTPLSTFTAGIHQMRNQIYKAMKRRPTSDEEKQTSTAPNYHGEKLFVEL
eukprot:TRINITY_DN3655_c0_g1_i1.p1 TRINITY_DN3655_c0_g1~~TRINITY_DN3655_c0_g1_i1.p1  ORF type:complete len:503 (+),score=93.10 TRINITY_DN3655_c0_g1_i1:143-1510(+)